MLSEQFLPGFPEGSTKVGDAGVSILNKEGRVTYFVGSDNYFSHSEGDEKARRFALALLIENDHVRPRDFEAAPWCIPHRTLMNWTRRLREHGADSFFRPPRGKKPRVMTPEHIAECEKLLAEGMKVSEVSKKTGFGESTIRKAISRGAVKKKMPREPRKTEWFRLNQVPRNPSVAAKTRRPLPGLVRHARAWTNGWRPRWDSRNRQRRDSSAPATSTWAGC